VETIIGTAIPTITNQFHSLDDIGWYGSSFFLALAAFQSTWGKVYKFFDIKYAFLGAIFWFEVGSLICGTLPLTYLDIAIANGDKLWRPTAPHLL